MWAHPHQGPYAVWVGQMAQGLGGTQTSEAVMFPRIIWSRATEYVIDRGMWLTRDALGTTHEYAACARTGHWVLVVSNGQMRTLRLTP